MKRLLLTILALCLLLVACGQAKPLPPEESTAQATTTQATTESYIPEIEHTITQQIHPDMPEFTFTVLGEFVYYHLWGWTFEMEGVEITGEDFSQHIEKPMEVFWYANIGFSFADFTGAGYLDVQLHLYRGRTMSDEPSALFWLWDTNTQQFVENEQLREISRGERISVTDDGHVVSYFSAGGNIGRARTVYAYENGEFVQVERWSTANQFDGTWQTWYYERINGEMVLVRTEVETIE